MCVYCEDNKEIVDTYDETVVIEFDVIHITVDGYTFSFEPNYCLMCGRKFEDE